MLYLAFIDTDLRDRFKDSKWLLYSSDIKDTTFTSDDVLVISEFVVKSRAELIDIIFKVHRAGARVIFVGGKENETFELKRQLVWMGVFDLYFAGDELDLREIDKLIEHPRTAKDVEQYFVGMDDVQPRMPTAVDIIEAEDTRDASDYAELATEAINEPLVDTSDTSSRVVWKTPDPVRIRLLSDSGVGKSFVAWNIASILNEQELPTAIIERNIHPLSEWVDLKSVHVMNEEPKKGYRVHLFTESEKGDFDLTVVIAYPDKYRIERAMLRLHELSVPSEKTVWIINRHAEGTPLPISISGIVTSIPDDPRQMGAVLMQTPLAKSDETFKNRFSLLTELISGLYAGKAKEGKNSELALARV